MRDCGKKNLVRLCPVTRRPNMLKIEKEKLLLIVFLKMQIIRHGFVNSKACRY